MSAVAVLGPGAVGGALAARMSAAGTRVVCVGRQETVARIRADGLELDAPEGVLRVRPEAVEQLREPVSLLVVAVKVPMLAEALERIEVFSVADGVVVPLQNGLEHPETLRRRLGPRVAPGSISRFQAALEETGRIRQWSPSALVTLAPGDLTRRAVDAAVAPVRDAGIDVVLAEDERQVLRLAVAVAEACAVAAADGVALQPDDQWAIIESMPYEATTSTARDLRGGRPSELDAITGSVLRAAHRLGVRCPALAALYADAEAACPA